MHRRLRRVVIGVAAMAADERVVLFAKHALTDAEFDGSSHTISDCSSDFAPYCSGLVASANGFTSAFDTSLGPMRTAIPCRTAAGRKNHRQRRRPPSAAPAEFHHGISP